MLLEEVLSSELNKLNSAAAKLYTKTYPNVPIGRPREFVLCKGVVWPYIVDFQGVYDYILVDKQPCIIIKENRYIVRKIIEKTGGQTQKVLRVIRRIQAAVAWCLKRVEGRKRAVQEILCQQENAAKILKSELILYELSRG